MSHIEDETVGRALFAFYSPKIWTTEYNPSRRFIAMRAALEAVWPWPPMPMVVTDEMVEAGYKAWEASVRSGAGGAELAAVIIVAGLRAAPRPEAVAAHPALPATASLREQIAEVRRELAMRERCYPGWIKSGSLPQSTADRQITRLRAVLATLESLDA